MNVDFDPVSGTIYQTAGNGNSGTQIPRSGMLEAKVALSATIDNSGLSQHVVTVTCQMAAVVSVQNSTTDGIKIDLSVGPVGFGLAFSSTTSSYAGGEITCERVYTLILVLVEVTL